MLIKRRCWDGLSTPQNSQMHIARRRPPLTHPAEDARWYGLMSATLTSKSAEREAVLRVEPNAGGASQHFIYRKITTRCSRPRRLQSYSDIKWAKRHRPPKMTQKLTELWSLWWYVCQFSGATFEWNSTFFFYFFVLHFCAFELGNNEIKPSI